MTAPTVETSSLPATRNPRPVAKHATMTDKHRKLLAALLEDEDAPDYEAFATEHNLTEEDVLREVRKLTAPKDDEPPKKPRKATKGNLPKKTPTKSTKKPKKKRKVGRPKKVSDLEHVGALALEALQAGVTVEDHIATLEARIDAYRRLAAAEES